MCQIGEGNKSEDNSEILQVMIKSGNGRIMNYVGMYVPPMTNVWQNEDHGDVDRCVKRS